MAEIVAPAPVEALSCVTNTIHPELAFVIINPCVYPAGLEGAEGQPRRATHGFLCTACWHKTLDALTRAPALILHLRSIQVGSQGLSDRVSTLLTWKLPVPRSWLVADSIMQALGAPPIPSTADLDETKALAEAAVQRWRSPEKIVSTVEGAVLPRTETPTMDAEQLQAAYDKGSDDWFAELHPSTSGFDADHQAHLAGLAEVARQQAEHDAPRAVGTVEELDALPDGTYILTAYTFDRDKEPLILRRGPDWGLTDKHDLYWWTTDGGDQISSLDRVDDIEHLVLPATVLWTSEGTGR